MRHVAELRRSASIVAVTATGLLSGCGPSNPPTVPRPTVTVTVPADEGTPTVEATSPPAPAPVTVTRTTTPAAPSPSASTGVTHAVTSKVSTRGAPAAAHERPSRGGVVLPPTTPEGPLGGRTVLVDPGHNGVYAATLLRRQVSDGNGGHKDCNTSGTANGHLSEHALTWSVSRSLVTDLRGRGATVVLTRPDDAGVGPCVDERAAIGNRAGVDVVVSVHADGNTSATARGFHVIRSTAMAGGVGVVARSTALAERVRDELASTPMPRSTYLGSGTAITPRRDIAGLNLSNVPAVMVEMGNMHHPADAALFDDSRFRSAVAVSLADAVESTLAG